MKRSVSTRSSKSANSSETAPTSKMAAGRVKVRIKRRKTNIKSSCSSTNGQQQLDTHTEALTRSLRNRNVDIRVTKSTPAAKNPPGSQPLTKTATMITRSCVNNNSPICNDSKAGVGTIQKVNGNGLNHETDTDNAGKSTGASSTIDEGAESDMETDTMSVDSTEKDIQLNKNQSLEIVTPKVNDDVTHPKSNATNGSTSIPCPSRRKPIPLKAARQVDYEQHRQLFGGHGYQPLPSFHHTFAVEPRVMRCSLPDCELSTSKKSYKRPPWLLALRRVDGSFEFTQMPIRRGSETGPISNDDLIHQLTKEVSDDEGDEREDRVPVLTIDTCSSAEENVNNVENVDKVDFDKDEDEVDKFLIDKSQTKLAHKPTGNVNAIKKQKTNSQPSGLLPPDDHGGHVKARHQNEDTSIKQKSEEQSKAMQTDTTVNDEQSMDTRKADEQASVMLKEGASDKQSKGTIRKGKYSTKEMQGLTRVKVAPGPAKSIGSGRYEPLQIINSTTRHTQTPHVSTVCRGTQTVNTPTQTVSTPTRTTHVHTWTQTTNTPTHRTLQTNSTPTRTAKNSTQSTNEIPETITTPTPLTSSTQSLTTSPLCGYLSPEELAQRSKLPVDYIRSMRAYRQKIYKEYGLDQFSPEVVLAVRKSLFGEDYVRMADERRSIKTRSSSTNRPSVREMGIDQRIVTDDYSMPSDIGLVIQRYWLKMAYQK